jgi:hypothetical protein
MVPVTPFRPNSPCPERCPAYESASGDGDGLGDAVGPAQTREPGEGRPYGEARPGPVAAEGRRTQDPCARHLSVGSGPIREPRGPEVCPTSTAPRHTSSPRHPAASCESCGTWHRKSGARGLRVEACPGISERVRLMADARSGEVWAVRAIRSPEGRMRRRPGADAAVSGATGPRNVPIEPLQAAQRAKPRTDGRGSIEVGERKFLSTIYILEV